MSTQARARLLLGAVLGALASSTALADAMGQGAGERVVNRWEVDMSGRPPYQRTLVELPVVDAAQLEIEDRAATAPRETVKIWTVRRSGSPPFRRQVEELPVEDLAALETVSSDNDRGGVFRGRPPFKRHR